MPVPESRPPISSAPLSLILVAPEPGAAVAEIIAEWRKVLQKRGQPFEILVAVDAETRENPAAESFPGMPEVRILHAERGRGFGAALRTGLAAAEHPLLCYAPAGGRYDPADLPKLLGAIDPVDLVAGYRVGRRAPRWLRVTGLIFRTLSRMALGIPVEPSPVWLGWPGSARRWMVRWVFGVFVYDQDCAFRLFRREVFTRLPIQSDGAFAHSEIIAKANFLGAYIAQAPVSYRPGAGAKLDKPTWREIRHVMSHPDFGKASSPAESRPAGPKVGAIATTPGAEATPPASP